MNLKKVLNKKTIIVDLKSKDKNSVIEELLDTIVNNGDVSSREVALKALLEREEKMSTGMELGIAIPHARTDAVKELHTAIGIHRTGVEFGALDGKPSNIFIMTLSPTGRSGPHIEFIATISTILSKEEKRSALINAQSSEDVFKILT